MANRSITTAIWSDPVFADLSAAAQLVFIRLVTGPETNAAGATQVLPKAIAVDCNLSRSDVEASIDDLIRARLVRRYDGWLWLPKWIDHQVSGQGFLVAARREATRRGLPRALSTAIRRALDARFGAVTEHTESADAAKHDTKKVAASRGKRGASRQPADRITEDTREAPGPYQYQDPLPTGGGGPSATSPAPAPGAQAPPRELDGTHTAGAIALAEVVDEVTDQRIGALLAAQVERMAAGQDLPDPGPHTDPGPAFTGDLAQEERVGAAGLRRWEEQAITRWQTSGDPRELRELQRSGSPPARAAVRSLLQGVSAP